MNFCPVDGEELPGVGAGLVGRVFDGLYQVEEFIARGGMGEIYKARHLLLEDEVALKLLRPEMRGDPQWLRRFMREGLAARRFRHLNAVAVHDLRTSREGETYLIMEYVNGRTLDEEAQARGGRFTLADCLKIVEAVADVLDAAHRVGIVHRDLKPTNIMITADGVVKLLDLGIAKIRDDATGMTELTMPGQLVGSPAYMPPEQWGQTPADGVRGVDGRADIYSLGVMTYEITGGERPFKADSLGEMCHAHCNTTPRPLEEFDASIPTSWSRAVSRAMSKDRRERQSTAGEFAAQLRAALKGEELNLEPVKAA